MPPPIHQTFDAHNFVVCSFVPRLFDYHPEGIPAPYNHSNIQSDEVLYYAEGNFMSRKGIDRSDISLHPFGLPHGPQPGMTEASIGKSETQELAVMVDTVVEIAVADTKVEAAKAADTKVEAAEMVDVAQVVTQKRATAKAIALANQEYLKEAEKDLIKN